MHEIYSVQCTDSNYWCDYFKCSRQVASNARQSSAKRSLPFIVHKIDDFMKFSCAIQEIKFVR